MFKKILIFILCTSIWFITLLLPIDYSYYSKLILPSFAPSNGFYSIAWTINYILLGYSMYSIFSNYKLNNIPKSYKLSLLINYLFNQSFVIVFFILKSSFLGFVSCVGTFVSSVFLYQESLQLNKKSTLVLRLYVLFNIFTIILSLAIYLLNG